MAVCLGLVAVAGVEAGALGGVVSTPGGAPLPGIEVSAYQPSSGGWRMAGWVTTGADGGYLLDGLPAGSYRVLFRDWSQTHAFEYHPDAARIEDGEDVVVAGGTTPLDASLEPAGRITGRVSDAVGAPLEFPMVFVWSAGSEPEVLFIATTNAATGDYDVGGLPSGEYLVQLSGRRGTESFSGWWDGVSLVDEASPVTVVAGEVTGGIDGRLGPPPGGYPGGVEGRVTGPGGLAAPDVEVSLYRLRGGQGWVLAGYQSFGPDGSYAFTGIEAGTYTLLFRDWNQVYAFRYWGGGSRLEDAVAIPVEDEVVPADVGLEVGGRIAGILSDPAGRPLEAPLVFVHTATDPPAVLFLATPDPDTGAYQLGGLPSGEYLVQFSGRQGLDSFASFYDGRDTLATADPVAVTLGETTAGIDGELGIPPGGVLAGRISDPYGRAFDFARVAAYRFDGADWVPAGEAETAYSESEYELPLPPGSYRLRFEAGSFLVPDLPAWEYFDDVPAIDDATEVAVELGVRRDGFDVTVGDLGQGTIAGTVTDAVTGAPLAGLEVWVADRRGRVLYDQIATTSATGEYLVTGLWPEAYLVEVYDPAFGYTTTRLPDPVVVRDAPVVGVDVALQPAAPGSLPGSITGTVVDDQGVPLRGVSVTASAVDDDDGGFGSTTTAADGRFRVRDLPAGSYHVRFADPAGLHVAEYFDDVVDEDGAMPLAVTDAATTAGVDAELAPAGAISGAITDRFGNSFFVAAAVAYAREADQWRRVASTSVVGESEYRLQGLPVGSYRVQLIGLRSATSTLSEFYDDQPDIDLADDVEVRAGEVTTGISGMLGQAPPGGISGQVTDGDGAPLAGIAVRAYDDRLELAAETATAADGRYDLTELSRGTYYVEFDDPAGAYPGEAWNDVAGLELATPIAIEDAVVTGIDAALDGAGAGPGGGGFRGVVRDDLSGQPVAGVRVSCVADDGWFVPGCAAVTASDGSFSLGGFLPAGSYLIELSSPSGVWTGEWYDDARSIVDATPVAAVEGAWTEGVDAGLLPAGLVAGTVTNPTGNAFPRLTVTAFRESGPGWEEYASFTTFYSSSFELGGLPAGIYRLRFRGGSVFNGDVFVEEFYDDAASLEDGSDVVVVAGATTAGLDAVLGDLAGPANLLDNPAFDGGLEPWVATVPDTTSLHHGAADAASAPGSGSAEIVVVGIAGPALSLSQCVAVEGGRAYRAGAWLRVTGDDAVSPPPMGAIEVSFHADAACGTPPLTRVVGDPATGSHEWQPLATTAPAPATARSARVLLTFDPGGAPGLVANWDEAWFGLETGVLFGDGFESGDSAGWSTSAP